MCPKATLKKQKTNSMELEILPNRLRPPMFLGRRAGAWLALFMQPTVRPRIWKPQIVRQMKQKGPFAWTTVTYLNDI